MYTIRRGGAYDRFIMMLQAFLKRNCEIHCLSLTPIPINDSHFYNHVLYFPFKTVDSFLARLAVFAIFPLWSFWVGWSRKIDFIIAFGSLYAFLHGFSKWILKRPLVTFIRGSSYFGMKMQNSTRYALYLNEIIEYLGVLFSDRIITNNEASRGEILKSLGKRSKIDVQVLHNNIPPMDICEAEDVSQARDNYGIPRDAKVLVTAGILNRGKNIETLIGCLPKTEIKDIYLLIVGDGVTQTDLHYKESLQCLAKRLKVNKQVIFTGWLKKEDLWKIYLASDLFVLPSLSEGMPNALLEALGFDLLCMGSDIPGIRDILQYDELLFDPLNERPLAGKIRDVFSDQQFLDRIKILCQKRKEIFEFDWTERIFQMVTMGFHNIDKNCQRDNPD